MFAPPTKRACRFRTRRAHPKAHIMKNNLVDRLFLEKVFFEGHFFMQRDSSGPGEVSVDPRNQKAAIVPSTRESRSRITPSHRRSRPARREAFRDLSWSPLGTPTWVPKLRWPDASGAQPPDTPVVQDHGAARIEALPYTFAGCLVRLACGSAPKGNGTPLTTEYCGTMSKGRRRYSA